MCLSVQTQFSCVDQRYGTLLNSQQQTDEIKKLEGISAEPGIQSCIVLIVVFKTV